MRYSFRGLGLVFFISLTAAATPPHKGGVEVWLFEGPTQIADVTQVQRPGDSSYSGSPFTADVRGRTDTIRIAGTRIDNGALQVGLIDITVAANLTVKNRTVIDILGKHIDKTIVIASLPNCGIHLWLKHPLSIAMPVSFDLRWIKQGPGARLEISDSGRAALRAHFDAQIDQLLSEHSFDTLFDHSTFNLSGPAEAAFNLFFNAKKGDLLNGLRNHLKAEIGRASYFDRFLIGLDRGIPTQSMGADQVVDLTIDRGPAPAVAGSPVTLPANTWVVREKGATPWFSPAVLGAVGANAASRPAASLLVARGKLTYFFRDYLKHLGAGSSPTLSSLAMRAEGTSLTYALSSQQTTELRALFTAVGESPPDTGSATIALPLEGPTAPIVQPWGASGQDKLYLDLWLAVDWLGAGAGSDARLGLLLVLGVDPHGHLSLAQVLPYRPANHAVGPAVNLRDQNAFGAHFAEMLKVLFAESWINARLGSAQTSGLPIRAIRLLGDKGPRAPGEKLGEALAVDFELPAHH